MPAQREVLGDAEPAAYFLRTVLRPEPARPPYEGALCPGERASLTACHVVSSVLGVHEDEA